MTGPKGIVALSYGAIACNTVLIGLLVYNTRFYNSEDQMAFLITGFGLVTAICYAVQLIRIRKAYYRHKAITKRARVILHICRVVQFLYSVAGSCLVGMVIYFSVRTPQDYYRNDSYKMLAGMITIVVGVTLNLTIFFKGWRLLKLVRKPYIDDVMSSFD
jgi:hypothetical protein